MRWIGWIRRRWWPGSASPLDHPDASGCLLLLEAPPQLDDGAVNDLCNMVLRATDNIADFTIGQAGRESKTEDLSVTVVKLRQVGDQPAPLIAGERLALWRVDPEMLQ